MIKNIADQHYQSVGRLFQKYGINKPVNEKNLAAAIVVYKKGFLEDLEIETGEEFNGFDSFGKTKKDLPGHDAAKSRHVDWNKIGDGITKGLEVAGAVAKTGIGIAGDVQNLKNGKKGDEGMAGDGSGGGAHNDKPSTMKKYLPFMIGGAVLLIAIIIGAVLMKKK
jgi:hypothetical protein